MGNDNPSKEKKNTILDESISILFNYLNSQESYVEQLQNRVHKILNRKTPEKIKTEAPVKVDEKTDIDFYQRLGRELERLYQINLQLDRLLLHLEEII